jgi:microsomal dipeptidase-like Zn-dependent dipeptidase
VHDVSSNIGMDMNPLEQILPVIAAFRAKIAAHPDRFVLPRTVADLVGVEHVGIGLDISFRQPGVDETPPGGFDPTWWWPPSAGYDRANPSTYPPISTWRELGPALQDLGMSASEAALVLGGNMQRVARRVWGG